MTLLQVPSPGHEPSDVIMLSKPYRVILRDGAWTEAHIEMAFGLADLVDIETVTLLWYDPGRRIWVPVTGQQRDPLLPRMTGDLPGEDVVMAIFGTMLDSEQNHPPHLVISFDIKDAYVDERLEFDASGSTDPDGGTLLFHWDLTDNGEPGPWVPGTRVSHVFEKEGTYEIFLRAIDGESEHFLSQNITIRAERDVQPGPLDNPVALFMLGSMLVLAFGLAVAYRLHRPRIYDDLFGKAYRTEERDEYSQLFRKLTDEDLRGEWDEEDEQGGEEDEDEEEEEGDEAEGSDRGPPRDSPRGDGEVLH